MEIVIDIDEHIYEQVMADSEVYVLDNEVDRILIENAIYEGTPLDKIRERISLEKLGYPPSAGYYRAIMKVLEIIDKYIEGSDAE